MTETYRALYEKGCAVLEKAGVPESALDARLLLEYVCHTDRNDLLVHGDQVVDEAQCERYLELIGRRAERIPLQHLTGEQDFMGLTFRVNEHVLIPRQDTEILVEEVLGELHDGMRILDMCTGSGCILISLLHYSNHCAGVGVDISEDALDVAAGNAERLLGGKNRKQPIADHAQEQDDPEEASFGVRWIQSNLFEKVEGRYDVIVSNPPYIRSDVIPTLMPEVREHEPMQALDGYGDGLFFYRRIIEESCAHLMRGGRLYFEIGYDQAEHVGRLMEEAGFREVTVVKDYAGLNRVVHGIFCWI